MGYMDSTPHPMPTTDKFNIAVYCRPGLLGHWALGRDSHGMIYTYSHFPDAENAARMWGDAYTLHGHVRIVKNGQLPMGKP